MDGETEQNRRDGNVKKKEEKEKTCNKRDSEIFSKLPRGISGQIYLARATHSYHAT